MDQATGKAAFRRVMGSFATGIAVVTAQNAELGAFGLTVNSLCSLSLDPMLLLFCLDKAAHLHGAFDRADLFAVNILAEGQADLSRHFASRDFPLAAASLWEEPKQGCPVLRGTLAWALCRPQARHDGGDHTIFVGKVVDMTQAVVEARPLLYFRGAYGALAENGAGAGSVTSGARR